jgi:lipid-binding SYLF domain-containing protein
MPALEGIVLQKSRNALRLIYRKKATQATIADRRVLKRATEIACEFVTR